jgi:hypothetical protein
VAILYPDNAWKKDYINDMAGGANQAENITLACVRSDSLDNAESLNQVTTR